MTYTFLSSDPRWAAAFVFQIIRSVLIIYVFLFFWGGGWGWWSWKAEKPSRFYPWSGGKPSERILISGCFKGSDIRSSPRTLGGLMYSGAWSGGQGGEGIFLKLHEDFRAS